MLTINSIEACFMPLSFNFYKKIYLLQMQLKFIRNIYSFIFLLYQILFYALFQIKKKSFFLKV